MAAQTSDIRKVAFASLIGSMLEWYDFFVFGSAAALAFNTLFFLAFSETAGIIASFATLAVGFVARPVGGIVFGHYGEGVGAELGLADSDELAAPVLAGRPA